MSHNLWMSEDTRYTLGFRMGARSMSQRTVGENKAEAPVKVRRTETSPIESLAQKLARYRSHRRS